MFERGEEIYNFRGVHRFKDKYDPVWQPRYIAAPNKWAIPILLADVGIMSSGGMGGLGLRSRKVKNGTPLQKGDGGAHAPNGARDGEGPVKVQERAQVR